MNLHTAISYYVDWSPATTRQIAVSSTRRAPAAAARWTTMSPRARRWAWSAADRAARARREAPTTSSWPGSRRTPAARARTHSPCSGSGIVPSSRRGSRSAGIALPSRHRRTRQRRPRGRQRSTRRPRFQRLNRPRTARRLRSLSVHTDTRAMILARRRRRWPPLKHERRPRAAQQPARRHRINAAARRARGRETTSHRPWLRCRCTNTLPSRSPSRKLSQRGTTPTMTKATRTPALRRVLRVATATKTASQVAGMRVRERRSNRTEGQRLRSNRRSKRSR